MKKTLLYCFLHCLMAMLMCATFTACSDDDDNDAISYDIVGRWQYAYSYDDGIEISEYTKDGEYILEYYRDGTSSSEKNKYKYEILDKGIMFYGDESGSGDICQYYIKGNTLYITEIGERDADGTVSYYKDDGEHYPDFEPDYEIWKRI